MRTETNLSLARTGENLAADYLQRKGMQILSRNYHTAKGELDIVAFDSKNIIFVEVKTRSGIPSENIQSSITHSKKTKLTLAAMKYLSDNPHLSNFDCRFDALIISFDKSTETFSISHLINCFEPVYP